MSGTTVDANIALNANAPKPVNPLVQAGQFAQTMGGLTNLQNTQLQLAGRNALMRAYQQAPIDPKTGLPDQAALIDALQHTPGGGLVLPDVIKSNQAQQLAGYQINQAQLAQAQNRTAAIGTLTAPLLSKIASGQPVTFSDVAGVINGAAARGYPTDEAVNAVEKTMPLPDPSRSGDPSYMADYNKKVAAWAGNFVKTTWGASAPSAVQAQVFTPNPQATNQGGKIVYRDTNAVTNPDIVGTQAPMSLTPEAQNTRVHTFKNGAPGTVPLASVAAPDTMPNDDGTPAPSPLGTGRYPTAAPGTAPAGEAPAGTPLPAPAAARGGFVQSGPALGQEAAAAHQGAAYGEMAGDLVKSASTVPAQKAILGNMQALLAGNSFGTGPGAQEWKNAIAGWNRIMPSGMAINVNGVGNQEEFTKLGWQLAQQQFGALGGTGTDAKLASAVHTSPSDFLSHLGNDGIISLLKGNADAIGVMGKEWQKWLADPSKGNNDPNTYGKFVTQFNQQFDPRVFQSQYMKNPAEVLQGMSPAEKQKFRQDYNAAVANGWIPDPRVPAGGANAGQ